MSKTIKKNPQSYSKYPQHYDVIVIGTGVVGCAIARQFALSGIKVLVLEKESDIHAGASKGNSAILHTGFDAPPGSLEQMCLADGYQQYLQIASQFNLPIHKTGALLLAWNHEQASQLTSIQKKAQLNGVKITDRLNKQAIHSIEPEISKQVVSGLKVPGEYIIDPWTTPYSYLIHAMQHKAELIRQCEVLSGEFNNNTWTLSTRQGTFSGHTVINCAGLYGDNLDQLLLGVSHYSIRPRKGQFVVFDKSAYRLIKSIILPVPNKQTKGVVICPTVFGNLLVGPTAEEQQSREDASVDSSQLSVLKNHAKKLVPALGRHSVTATYAGIRPATEHSDYQIAVINDKQYISVNGIRSTGLSAALGIARYVFSQCGHEAVGVPSELKNASSVIPILAESKQRDWQNPNNKGIVCFCEWVTRREIENALNSNIPPMSLGALKRRTRVTMGRCQGFYCSAAIAKLTAGQFESDMALQDLGSSDEETV